MVWKTENFLSITHFPHNANSFLVIPLRGYCSRCKEYRSDNGMDAWRITWKNGNPTCERCGFLVDVWESEDCDE